MQDLKLPKWTDLRTEPEPPKDIALPKFGFMQMFEEIFDKDLRKDNPWFNPVQKHKRFKKVRFCTTEISPNERPHCRRHCQSLDVSGQLHTSLCSNSCQETVEVLGSNAWQNRVFIFEYYQQKN